MLITNSVGFCTEAATWSRSLTVLRSDAVRSWGKSEIREWLESCGFQAKAVKTISAVLETGWRLGALAEGLSEQADQGGRVGTVAATFADENKLDYLDTIMLISALKSFKCPSPGV